MVRRRPAEFVVSHRRGPASQPLQVALRSRQVRHRGEKVVADQFVVRIELESPFEVGRRLLESLEVEADVAGVLASATLSSG